MPSFTLSVETDAGTYRLPAVYLDANGARNAAVATIRRPPMQGTRIITIAVMRDGAMHDVFDGREWSSDMNWDDNDGPDAA